MTKTALPAIRRVAVVGAGAGGLVAAKTLLAEKAFDTVDIFEQREDLGGLWNYTSETSHASIPSIDPSVGEDVVETDGRKTFVSAIYDRLETNIPKTLMVFPTHSFSKDLPLFPPHEAVRDYLKSYGSDIRHLINFSTRVSLVSKLPTGHWVLSLLSTRTSAPLPPRTYDAVVVSTGHYNIPHIPAIPGLSSFASSHPGVILHSKSYRSPTDYANQKVLVIGNSVSGFDIALQLVDFVEQPLLQSIRSPSEPASDKICVLEEIERFDEGARGVVLRNGTKVGGLDKVIFCTGYLHSLPFIEPPADPLITDGSRVRGLWKHIFYIADPTLSFLGLPSRVIPFPLMHNQARLVATVYSHRFSLPERQEMEAWEKELIERKGDGKGFHIHPFPMDADYICELEEMVDEVEVEGKGIEPVKWRQKERWVRERILRIRECFRRVRRKEGRVAKTMEEVGFEWETGKEA